MNDKVAQVISVVMHPLLMPTYLFLLIRYAAPELFRPFSDDMLFSLLMVVFIASFVLPMLSLVSMRYSNTIKSFSLDKRKERVLPFSFITLFYGITTYFFYTKLRFNDLLYVTFLAVTILLVCLLIITIYWKVSIHSAAMGGIVGFIYGLLVKSPLNQGIYLLVFGVMIWGIVSVARLKLNAHTPQQIYIGTVVGFLICFAFYYVML